jgi:hypothetical protein
MQVVMPLYCLGEAGQYDGKPHIWYPGQGPEVSEDSTTMLQGTGSAGASSTALMQGVDDKLLHALQVTRSLLSSCTANGNGSAGQDSQAVTSPSAGPVLMKATKLTDAGPLVCTLSSNYSSYLSCEYMQRTSSSSTWNALYSHLRPADKNMKWLKPKDRL